MTPKFQFSSVNRVPHNAWGTDFLGCDHPAGTVLLMGPGGCRGALAKLTKAGFFITLTPAEAMGAEPIRWPGSGSLVRFGETSLIFE